MPDSPARKLGVVVIGRNEGNRLRLCLESVLRDASCVVYVDSGSSDDSVTMASGLGASVVDLDMSVPFTAARARNEGFRRLCDWGADLEYVQFVDGDCEIVDGWLGKARTFLDKCGDVAMVCGRLRERNPGQSVYNMICDIEWDTPVGAAMACGGIAMTRVRAFKEVGGFRQQMIAGEEPELCVRLRQSGWKIWRLGEDMAWHDAAMTRFDQWWKRATRSGYAFAEGAYLHGAPPERHWVAESWRIWLWGLGIPLVALVAFAALGVYGLLLLLIYPAQIVRLALKGGRTPYQNIWRAFFLVVGKFPEMLGQMKFLLHRLAGRQGRLIEYK